MALCVPPFFLWFLCFSSSLIPLFFFLSLNKGGLGFILVIVILYVCCFFFCGSAGSNDGMKHLDTLIHSNIFRKETFSFVQCKALFCQHALLEVTSHLLSPSPQFCRHVSPPLLDCLDLLLFSHCLFEKKKEKVNLASLECSDPVSLEPESAGPVDHDIGA